MHVCMYNLVLDSALEPESELEPETPDKIADTSATFT